MAAPIPYLGFRFLLLGSILMANAFFAASEVALLSVRESRLRQLAEEGQAGARVALALLANPERLLSVTQVGVTLASLGLGWAGEDTLYNLLLRIFGGLIGVLPTTIVHTICFLIGFLTITFCHVILGEVAPKNLSVEKADRLATILAPALMVFYRVSAPFVVIVERSAAFLMRAMGVKGRHAGGHSAEELRLIVSAIGGSGRLPEAQEEMIQRVLDLEDLQVREIMVPRNDIVSVSSEATMDEVLHVMASQQHSRLPVYQKKPEQIIGILHYKDLLALWDERRKAIRSGKPPRPFRVLGLLRKHTIVPETKPVIQMLAEFRSGQSHMALVVDEFDETVVRPLIDTGDLEIEGTTPIRDLEMHYEIELPDNSGFETVAGFMLWKLGHIPIAGEQVAHEDRRYTVVAVDHNRITRIRVEKIPRLQVIEQPKT